MKKCPSCKTEKELNNFHKCKTNKDGLHYQCKLCRSNYVKINRKKNLKRYRDHGIKYRSTHKDKIRDKTYKWSYGLSLIEFNQMKFNQNEQCLLCDRKAKLCVDHDHKTGKIRGLLCRSCNGALGVLGDNAESLQKVIKYLEEKL